MRGNRGTIAGLLVLVCGCAQSEWARAYRLPDVSSSDSQLACFLVRDARTGRPIEGARVRQYDRPYNRVPEGKVLSTHRTDSFGLSFVVVEGDREDFIWVVDAPGYAPAQAERTAVDLFPATPDRVGRILDPWGEPLPGAEVSCHLEHPSGLALISTRTDAKGGFALRDPPATEGDYVDFRAAGVESQLAYYLTDVRLRGLPLRSFPTLPCPVIKGKVLRADGTPEPGGLLQDSWNVAPVGQDGTFTLVGVPPSGSVTLYTRDGSETEFSLAAFRPGGPIVLSLGNKAPPRTCNVTVVLKDEQGREVFDRVFLDRVSDGRRYEGGDEWFAAAMEVPPGKYELRVGDDFSHYVAPPRPVDVTGDSRLSVQVAPQPELEVARKGLPEGAWVYLVLEGAYRELKRWPPVHLPAGARAVVQVRAEGDVQFFPVAAVRGGLRRVSIDWRPPATVVVPFSEAHHVVEVGPSAIVLGQPAAEGADTSIRIRTHATGRLRFWLEDAAGRVATVSADLPDTRGAETTVDSPKFSQASKAIMVVDGKGRPVRGADVSSIESRPLPESPACSWGWGGQTDEHGMLQSPSFREGTFVCVSAGRQLPVYRRLRGPGPYRIALGDAALHFEAGEKFTVFIDGEVAYGDVSGLLPGPHRLVVWGASGRAEAFRVLLAAGETRTIRPWAPTAGAAASR